MVRYSAATRTLMADARRLTLAQRALPEATQWTLGGLVKHALAAASVAMECDRLGIR